MPSGCSAETGVGEVSSVHAGSPQVSVVEEVLDDLVAHDLACAPRVAAQLVQLLDGDPQSIREVSALLDATERAGTRPLPRRLPLVAAIVERFAGLEIDPDERAQLVAAALSLDDRIGPVLVACGLEASADTGVSVHLLVHAGRFRFREHRLAIWIVASSSAQAVSEAHRRLASAHVGAGNATAGAWHRARSSAFGDRRSAVELLSAATRLADEGDSERAMLFASEAAAHTDGRDHDAARLLAGVAAVGAGYMDEAVGWLGALFPDGDQLTRLRGLAALLVAHAHLQGAVPEIDASRYRPRHDAREEWHAWSRAAAFGAELCAERGDRSGARAWIDLLREGAAREDSARELRDPVVSLIWLLLGEAETDDANGTGPVTGIVLGALRCAVAGDVDGGLRILATGESRVLDQDDPFIAGFESSDLIHAHRVVIDALLRVWKGDIACARARLCEASLRLPVSVPFAGLGVVLARRLDLAVLGRLGPFALSLTAAVPPASRTDQLVDRAIRAHLAGEAEVASSCLRLWLDRGAPQPTLSVPGLDESAPMSADLDARTRHRVEPPEVTLGRSLRLRAATSVEPAWRGEVADVVEAARAIASPFERARVEAALATRALIDDAVPAARGHLLAAWQLFDESGASAWADAVADRLSRVDSEYGQTDDSAAFTAMRRRWEDILTPRELEVALFAVQGGSNRDIAAALTVSVRTVEVHLGRVFTKLGVRSRVDLVLLGHRSARYG